MPIDENAESTLGRRGLLRGMSAVGALAAVGTGAAVAAPAAAAYTKADGFYTLLKASSLYPTAGYGSTAVAWLQAGQKLVPTGRISRSWVQVRAGSRTGWIVASRMRFNRGPKTAFDIPFSHGGKTIRYHIHANQVDYSKTVRYLWVLHGDFSASSFNYRLKNWGWWRTGSSPFYVAQAPWGNLASRIAEEAARRNFVVITPVAPLSSNGQHHWWSDYRRNGDIVRALAAHLSRTHPAVSRYSPWLLGYSGGSELITKELLAYNQRSWLDKVTNATIVAGGGRPKSTIGTTSPHFRSSQLRWHVAKDDSYGATTPRDWSAYYTSFEGRKAYAGAHYHDTKVLTYPSGGHSGYDLAALVNADMSLKYPRLR